MENNPSAKSHNPLASNEFYSHLLDSLGDLNILLTDSDYLELQQEINALLLTSEKNSDWEELLLPAIRLKLYALLALTH